MTIQLHQPALFPVRGIPRWAETTTLSAEVRHDALQSVATIMALLAAGRETVTDPQLTRTRLEQVESQVRALRSYLDDPGDPPARGVDVVVETCDLVRATTVDYPGTVDVVTDTAARADVARSVLHRIVGNLLRNAMRAAGPDGCVRVTVSPVSEGVAIEVEDSGPGFGVLPIIHGVGLRSARALARRAGGRVETRSSGRLGGARVRVCLPAARTETRS